MWAARILALLKLAAFKLGIVFTFGERGGGGVGATSTFELRCFRLGSPWQIFHCVRRFSHAQRRAAVCPRHSATGRKYDCIADLWLIILQTWVKYITVLD